MTIFLKRLSNVSKYRDTSIGQLIVRNLHVESDLVSSELESGMLTTVPPWLCMPFIHNY